jgi:hypothetical protein
MGCGRFLKRIWRIPLLPKPVSGRFFFSWKWFLKLRGFVVGGGLGADEFCTDFWQGESWVKGGEALGFW